MSVHVIKCNKDGVDEWHIRYPGMTQKEAQQLADDINSGAIVGRLATFEVSGENTLAEPVVLPEPDLTLPSSLPDGPEGAHFYRASTVRGLLENARALRLKIQRGSVTCDTESDIESSRVTEDKDDFKKSLEIAINKHSMENGSNTPDYVLAHYLAECLNALDKAVRCREEYYGGPPDSSGDDALV